ncbi:hypothetical protein ACG1BZ_19515 [Microbulbifer sp. CNSA002]|uniref:hypothetical protein n=1 Tax=Microbulbifer sp. CNSA002 TaxID=3373604 RepID=UPI0039B3A009
MSVSITTNFNEHHMVKYQPKWLKGGGTSSCAEGFTAGAPSLGGRYHCKEGEQRCRKGIAASQTGKWESRTDTF